MLAWIRDKLFRRQSDSRQLSNSSDETNATGVNRPNSSTQSNMQSEEINKIILLCVIYEGEMWVISVDCRQVIYNLLTMALTHFLNPTEVHNLAPKYKFIHVSQNKVLNLQCLVGDVLKTNDEILLVEKISIATLKPLKLTLQDVKGPTKQEIMAATGHLQKKNTLLVVPSLDCQENFQTEIRKVLYSLVEVSAKVLAQNPDAKVIFNTITARINAKNKSEIDKNAIKYLVELGFTEAQARYALRLKRNRQVEAMEWLLENSHRVKEEVPSESTYDTSTSDIHTMVNDPVHIIEQLLQDIREFHRCHFEPSTRALDILQAMGFSQDDAIEALKITNNNQVAACEFLCGERDDNIIHPSPGLDVNSPIYKALMNNPTIQIGFYNPKIMLAFLSILENPSSANLWLNDIDTAPVLGQVFKTYHSEKHMMLVNQQMELMKKHQNKCPS